MELKDKIAVVTGVSKGIGNSLVRQLLQKGTIVFGLGRSAPDIQHSGFHFISTDVSIQREVDNAFIEIFKHTDDKIHVLINNAGLGYFRIMEELTPEEWREMFDVNVHGIFYCSKKVIPVMKQQQYGHIVNIASVAGLLGLEEATGYCGTKFAVRGISEAMFKELRKFNIKVSCIYPGSVNTGFFRNYPAITANDSMMHPNDVAKVIIQTLETPDNFITLNVELRPLIAR